ncbi:MAG: hypothetical protein IJV08_11415 [Bacteroidaceae bacterium]|nr:hypothetical protein [Bacteroidaceae bacterium]MBR1449534.1 hypothetical protein [Prevotella sp.]
MNDLHNVHLWVANDIVCQMSVEGERYPSVMDVRAHWRFVEMDDVTNDEIQKIIDDVRGLDEFDKVCRMMSDPLGVCSVNPDDY